MQGESAVMNGSRLATVKEAARFLRVSVAKLYELMKSGELPSVKLGKSRRIAWAELEALLQRSTVAK
jgi:excisionase family DNA binding protein